MTGLHNPTALQLATLAAIGDGKVSEVNTGHGSWRIWGANPSVVGRLRSLGLTEKTRVDDRKYAYALTGAGRALVPVEQQDAPEAQEKQMIQTGEYRVDLRRNGGRDLTDRTATPSRAAAFVAFRELLARTDLEGQDVAARFVVDGKSLYYSAFNKPFGQGRIHPDAPIRPGVDRVEADRLAGWLPVTGGVVNPATEITLALTESDRRAIGALLDEVMIGERLVHSEYLDRADNANAYRLLCAIRDATGPGTAARTVPAALGAHHALARLFILAKSDTGQARRVANFLMACWNATELGGFDPVDLNAVDRAIGLDMVEVMAFFANQPSAIYFDALGFGDDIQAVIQLWKPA